MKKYHMAHKLNGKGGVSALCFQKTGAIDLTRALWTNRPEAVMAETGGRIPTERLSLADWHDLAKAAAMAPNAEVTGAAPEKGLSK